MLSKKGLSPGRTPHARLAVFFSLVTAVTSSSHVPSSPFTPRHLKPTPLKSRPNRVQRQCLTIASHGMIALSLLLRAPIITDAQTWDFVNGKVELMDPISFKGIEPKLRNPRLLGSGGGGAVFALKPDGGVREVAVKVSWSRSAPDVANECKVLQFMRDRRVSGVETCRGTMQYPGHESRLMIALEPVVDNENSVERPNQLEKRLQGRSVRGLMRTMVEMLNAGVVSADVQPLIDRTTGDALLVDMTEAKIMSSPPTSLDISAAGNFVSEMIALVPEDEKKAALEFVTIELQELQAKGDSLPNEIVDLLQSAIE